MQSNAFIEMRRFAPILLYLCLCLQALGCAREQSQAEQSSAIPFDASDFAHTVEVKHAKGFAVQNHPSYKELSILSPEGADTIASYILYPRDSVAPDLGNPQYKYIPIPLQTIACTSTPEVGALPVLDLRERLVACSSPDYVSDSLIRERIRAGLVQDIGKGMSRNLEQIIATRPDILLQDVYSASDKDEDLASSGIHIVYYNNWKEQSPLGRAEWLKVVALFFGRNVLASRAFDEMARRYEEVKALVPENRAPTPIMYGAGYKGVWYIPGEYSYQAWLFADAHISYDLAQGQMDSQPTNFEYVYQRHHDKKIWLCSMTGGLATLQDFVALNERYADFEAVRSGEVWADRKRINPSGGNDFWESGPYHPDLLLKDLVKICHPDLLPEYETTYWIELKR